MTTFPSTPFLAALCIRSQELSTLAISFIYSHSLPNIFQSKSSMTSTWLVNHHVNAQSFSRLTRQRHHTQLLPPLPATLDSLVF